MQQQELKRNDLIYPELSYQIVGILFEVYNEIGIGYQEKYYQRAIAECLKKHNLSFREQVLTPLKFQENKIGNYFLDFLIENKIVLEIKRGEGFAKTNIQQVSSYLKAANLKLGILANFTSKGLKSKRILNIN
jgi:GxxExxY protein